MLRSASPRGFASMLNSNERSSAVEIRIGVQNVAREITFETDMSDIEVVNAVSAALEVGGVLTLKDGKGRQVIVPGAALGYVHIGESEKGRVGFGTV